jgi:IS5 family transposase
LPQRQAAGDRDSTFLPRSPAFFGISDGATTWQSQPSSASEHDTLHSEEVIDPANTSRDIYADKDYIDGEREARLKSEGWRMHIQRKGSKDKALSKAQERRNRRIASPRARVEHIFAGLAQLGGKTLRLIGLARATLHLNWKAAIYN